MKKTFKLYMAIWAILLVLFNVIAFVSGGVENQEKYTTSFWIGYVFINIAFGGQLICAIPSFKIKNLQKLFYNISLISLSWTGLIISFVVGGLCMLLPVVVPYWVGAIVCAIVLAFVAIGVIKAGIAADAVSVVDDKIKVKTFFIKALTVDAEALIAIAQNDEIKAECKKVYEAIRFSDPMSCDVLATLESQITIKMSALEDVIKANDLDAVKALAKEVIILVDNRNKKCKLLK